MTDKIKQVVKKVIAAIPGKDTIVFESRPDFSDNTRAVFDEMVRRGLDKQYRMYWWVSKKDAALKDHPNIRYLYSRSFWGLQKYRWITIRAKALICCNDFFVSSHAGQKSFFLTHGTAIKGIKNYYLPEGVDYMVVASEHAIPAMARDLRIAPERVYGLGYPRNDVLTQPGKDLHAIFDGDFQKIVVWYPTFRQHKGGSKTAVANSLPVLHDSAAAEKLNQTAKERGILIVVKPHFAQDVSYITKHNLSNLRFIDDQFFVDNKMTSYEFVGSCDAMITDYSSIYFDFLLCDKPCAVIWEDIELYRQNPGFSVDPDIYMAGSHKLYTLEDFQSFLGSVAAGEDPYHQERNRLCDLMNCSRDGRNTQRVTDFIVEKAGL